jgi:hypothetical protein
VTAISSRGVRANAAVAKYAASRSGLRAHYLGGEGSLMNATIEGIESPLETGTRIVTLVRGKARRPLELTITARGRVFDLRTSSTDGVVSARGMGMVDPEFQDSLLVSSWSGDLRPAGIVKYQIGHEPDRVVATYTSVMLESTGFDDVLGGVAVGNTEGGFPGTYSITYRGEGDAQFGPYDWTITPRGDVFDLSWDAGGVRQIEGFGFLDPDSDRSIVVVYGAPSHTD